MTKKLNFVLGIHNHQPVGNMPWVFQKVYERAYQPFLAHLEQHPKIKATLHYSGILLQWLEENHPEMIDLLRRLLERDQIEINTGGIYEPILAIIPDPDKVGQIKEMTALIKRVFGYTARGMWLAERVWEPHLARTISEAGVEYLSLDDTHFLGVGMRENELSGYFLTEEAGRTLKLFPASLKLRYLIPFASPQEVLAHLKKLWEKSEDEGSLAVISDDGEKFGSWPDTYEQVYEKRWLEKFFALLEDNSHWLRTTTFSEYLDLYPPKGRVYLPTASYREMSEWALPPEMAARYQELVSGMKERGDFERYSFLVKGGYWRNFLIMYPEANNLHKKMLYVSEKVHGAGVADTFEELWKGQCNDGYWHGIFGGLYLPHLRSALYSHLIKAETLADSLLHPEESWQEIRETDFDADGFAEILVSNSRCNFYFDPAEGGVLFELDHKSVCVNLLDTLARRKEPYHQEILKGPKKRKKGISIHERSKVIDRDLANFLHYDSHRKVSFIDHFFPLDTDLQAFKNCAYEEIGDFVDKAYLQSVSGTHLSLEREGRVRQAGKDLPVRVEKRFEPSPQRAEITAHYRVTNMGREALRGSFGVELNVHVLGKIDIFHQDKLQSSEKLENIERQEVSEITLKDTERNLSTKITVSKEARLWVFPVETVSQSEEGFERIYQSTVIVPYWELNLAGSESWQMELVMSIEEGAV